MPLVTQLTAPASPNVEFQVKDDPAPGPSGPYTANVTVSWDPNYLTRTAHTAGETYFDNAQGIVVWTLQHIPREGTVTFTVDFTRATAGTTFVVGTAVECVGGERDTDYTRI